MHVIQHAVAHLEALTHRAQAALYGQGYNRRLLPLVFFVVDVGVMNC